MTAQPTRRSPRCTVAQRNERVVIVSKLLSRAITDPVEVRHALNDYIQKHNGYTVGLRRVRTYMSLAKERHLAAVNQSAEDMRADSHRVYLGVIQDPKSSARDRIAAQRAIDRLHGLEQPIKVAQTNTGGDDVVTRYNIVLNTLSVEELRVFNKIGEAAVARLPAPDAGGNGDEQA